MEIGTLLFFLLFFLASLIYLYLGGHIIRINPKERVNRAFLAFSIALCIWSFGYAVVSSTQDIEAALFWRRVASVGRMCFFSATLHFMLLLTHTKDQLTQKWVALLLHIPAVLLIYVFSVSNTMAPLQYQLIKISYGWVDKPVHNIWTIIYYVYFVSYMLISLGVVLRWKKKLRDKKLNTQANVIFATMTSALLFGGLLDILPSLIFENPLPQLTSVIILLPTWAMYYAAKHYGVFDAEIVRQEEYIVTTEEQKKIFANIGIAMCIGGIIAFAFAYFSDTNEDFGNSGIFAAIGICIILIQKIKTQATREAYTIVFLLVSIPVVMFQLLNLSALTVWVYPIVIMVSSIQFSKRTLLVSSTSVAIATQIGIWILRPESQVTVNKYDYMLRILIFIIIFLIGMYANKIYVAKIRDNNYQILFQKMVSDSSFDFVALKRDNFEEKVNSLLESIGLFFHVERAYLFTINHQTSTMIHANEWCCLGLSKQEKFSKEIPLATFPWWISQLTNSKSVYLEDVTDMTEEASAEKEQLLKRDVKSVVLLPVVGGEEIQGFIGVDSVTFIKKWAEEEIKLLNIMGNLLASALIQIKSVESIEFMAYNDHLTKLPNRFSFRDRANQAIHLSKDTGKLISIIFIDLDNFKAVNDTIGHEGGDLLLKEVAQNLTMALDTSDTVARFGGDEFMIMLNNVTNQDCVIRIVDKIMSVFENTFIVNGHEFIVTASAGIALYPRDGEDPETLLKNADIAMYQAKMKGKNQYALCTKEMKDEVQMNLDLSNDLHYALERNELVVYYQPQIDLVTGKISGVEALLRWMHPTKGMILPLAFIPIAEENGLINSIGEWVLKSACQQNKKWQDMGLPSMKMAVNLSAIQFINPNIAENIESILDEMALDPQYLELEITESIAIREADYVLKVLNKLKKIGVSIAIDDFGTEYSSLSRLKLLPIDRIKIDMQFVQGIENSPKDQAITMVIINLAKSLGLNVLAEGVETGPQSDFLNQKMCDNVQGFFYYKPMPAEEMEAILIDMSSNISNI